MRKLRSRQPFGCSRNGPKGVASLKLTKPLSSRDSGQLVETDVACLEHACNGVTLEIWCETLNYAESYAVPPAILLDIVLDRLLCERCGLKPTPASFFVGTWNAEPLTAKQLSRTIRRFKGIEDVRMKRAESIIRANNGAHARLVKVLTSR